MIGVVGDVGVGPNYIISGCVLWRVRHLHCTYTDAMVKNVRSWGCPGGAEGCVLMYCFLVPAWIKCIPHLDSRTRIHSVNQRLKVFELEKLLLCQC